MHVHVYNGASTSNYQERVFRTKLISEMWEVISEMWKVLGGFGEKYCIFGIVNFPDTDLRPLNIELREIAIK